MIRSLLQLPRTVWLLALVSLFNDSASELVYPLVPLYLAGVLSARPAALGLIEGIAEAAGSLLKTPSFPMDRPVQRSERHAIHLASKAALRSK